MIKRFTVIMQDDRFIPRSTWSDKTGIDTWKSLQPPDKRRHILWFNMVKIESRIGGVDCAFILMFGPEGSVPGGYGEKGFLPVFLILGSSTPDGFYFRSQMIVGVIPDNFQQLVHVIFLRLVYIGDSGKQGDFLPCM